MAPIEIIVKIVTKDKQINTHPLEIELYMTVWELKCLISKKYNIYPDNQILYCQSGMLENTKKIVDCQIIQGSVVRVLEAHKKNYVIRDNYQIFVKSFHSQYFL